MVLQIDYYPVQWANYQGRSQLIQKNVNDVNGHVRKSRFDTSFLRLGIQLKPERWNGWYVGFDGYLNEEARTCNLEVGNEFLPGVQFGLRAGVGNTYVVTDDNKKSNAGYSFTDNTETDNNYAYGIRATFDKLYASEGFSLTPFVGVTRSVRELEKDVSNDGVKYRRNFSTVSNYFYVGQHLWVPVEQSVSIGSSAELGYTSETHELSDKGTSNKDSYTRKFRIYHWRVNVFQIRFAY